MIPQPEIAQLEWQAIAADLGFSAPRSNGRRKRNGRARSADGKFARNQSAQDQSAYDRSAYDRSAQDQSSHDQSALGELTRNGMRLRARGDWLEALIPTPVDRDGGSPHGAPGLWRDAGESDARARIFEIPRVSWAGAFATDETDSLDEEPGAESRALGALLDWAEATADGAAPSNWRAPDREEVDSWLAPRRLVARSEAHVAQAEIACEPDRLAIAFPALVKTNGALGSAREAWLRALCCDAEARWRFVRVGVDDRNGGVRAEVDLTGVPAACARSLAQLSLEALICAAEWALPALAFIGDPSTESRVLDRHPATCAGLHDFGSTGSQKHEE